MPDDRVLLHLRTRELEQLIAEQRADLELDRRAKARRRGGRGRSIFGAVSLDTHLDSMGYRSGGPSLHEYVSAQARGYLVEWLDPVADEVIPRVDADLTRLAAVRG